MRGGFQNPWNPLAVPLLITKKQFQSCDQSKDAFYLIINILFSAYLLGDLTDAKDQTKINSAQYIEEWDTYSRVLKETKVEEQTKWLDIRGNHGIMCEL